MQKNVTVSHLAVKVPKRPKQLFSVGYFYLILLRVDEYLRIRLNGIEEEGEKKLALFMKRIINFQQMMRCKGVLLRKDWKIINLLVVSGLQEDGSGYG